MEVTCNTKHFLTCHFERKREIFQLLLFLLSLTQDFSLPLEMTLSILVPYQNGNDLAFPYTAPFVREACSHNKVIFQRCVLLPPFLGEGHGMYLVVVPWVVQVVPPTAGLVPSIGPPRR